MEGSELRDGAIDALGLGCELWAVVGEALGEVEGLPDGAICGAGEIVGKKLSEGDALLDLHMPQLSGHLFATSAPRLTVEQYLSFLFLFPESQLHCFSSWNELALVKILNDVSSPQQVLHACGHLSLIKVNVHIRFRRKSNLPIQLQDFSLFPPFRKLKSSTHNSTVGDILFVGRPDGA
mmetsp:Transcript_24698/g.37773  ORF Transcript_24698/g.37773 Transcript_24698/m.37773 type:complete len:179 (+) Transcript_24698:1026-1562(+)